jgi:hypothetical protein
MTVTSTKDYTGHICENPYSEQDVALQIKYYVSDVTFQLLFFTCSCTHAVMDLKLLLNQDHKNNPAFKWWIGKKHCNDLELAWVCNEMS